MLAEERLLPSGEARSAAGDLANRMMGLGVLDPFLHQDGVEEIIVRNGTVLIGINGQVGKSGVIAPDLYFYALAQRVAEILTEAFDLADDFVVVAGDLNDTPDSDPLSPLLGVANLHNIVAELPVNERFTHIFGNEKSQIETAANPQHRPPRCGGARSCRGKQ